MAKGAATESAMGKLHESIARVFEKVLATYETRLDAVATTDTDQIGEDMMEQLMSESVMPSPAMLSAITTFLKNNAISFDTEQVAKLSATQERLNERKKKRTSLAQLTTLTLVEASG